MTYSNTPIPEVSLDSFGHVSNHNDIIRKINGLLEVLGANPSTDDYETISDALAELKEFFDNESGLMTLDGSRELTGPWTPGQNILMSSNFIADARLSDVGYPRNSATISSGTFQSIPSSDAIITVNGNVTISFGTQNTSIVSRSIKVFNVSGGYTVSFASGTKVKEGAAISGAGFWVTEVVSVNGVVYVDIKGKFV